MPNFRRGAAAIEEAAEKKGGGDFRPFVPTIQWKDDKENKYVLFLTSVEDIVTAEYHEWIPVGKGEKSNGDTYTKYEQFISRKDPAIGEDYDELQDRLDVDPKVRNFAVAVQLEAVTETEKDSRGKERERVVGFEVATSTFTRKDENDNEEEVTQPVVGIVIQAPNNFFGWLASYDASQGPIEDTAMHVTRRGKGTDTAYDFIPMEGRSVDLTNLIDYLDGVTYLRDEMDDLIASFEQADSDEAIAALIGDALLNKRLDELADKERYDKLVGPIEHIEQKYGKKKGKKDEAKKERPARPSRRAKQADAEPAEAKQEAEPKAAEEPKEAPATKNDRFAKLRAKVEAKNAA